MDDYKIIVEQEHQIPVAFFIGEALSHIFEARFEYFAVILLVIPKLLVLLQSNKVRVTLCL